MFSFDGFHAAEFNMRKVVENRNVRERTTRAAKTALVALEMGATSRAMSAAAQDTASRWSRDKGLEDMEDACLSG